LVALARAKLGTGVSSVRFCPAKPELAAMILGELAYEVALARLQLA